MTFPASAAVVVVKGYWWADDGTGVPRQVTATPSVDHVTSASGRGVIDLVEKTATPDGDNPYWELELVASNDPDLIPTFAWTFRMSGYDGAWTVTVPHDAELDSDDRPSVWLTELDPLVEIPEPQTSDYYYTKNQVDQKFTDHIGLSTPGWDPHPQYRLDSAATDTLGLRLGVDDGFSVAQEVDANAFANILFDTVQPGTPSGVLNSTTGALTIPAAGVWLVGFRVRLKDEPAASINLGYFLNDGVTGAGMWASYEWGSRGGRFSVESQSLRRYPLNQNVQVRFYADTAAETVSINCAELFAARVAD